MLWDQLSIEHNLEVLGTMPSLISLPICSLLNGFRAYPTCFHTIAAMQRLTHSPHAIRSQVLSTSSAVHKGACGGDSSAST